MNRLQMAALSGTATIVAALANGTESWFGIGLAALFGFAGGHHER